MKQIAGWMVGRGRDLRLLMPLLLLCVQTLPAVAQNRDGNGGSSAPILSTSHPGIRIPKLDRAPALADFLAMKPQNGFEGKLAKVDHFIQQIPKDGDPETQRTEAYLGYDDKSLYIIFVAFDTEPRKIRARMSRRDHIYDDDLVQVMLDTFHDRRRAYSFVINPLGVQLDRLYTEGQDFDDSFDTVWSSDGTITETGYVALMAIPFRSLRFSPDGGAWGIVLQRIIPRVNEKDFWPRVSSRIEGRLSQEADMSGIERISPGRNMQFIPYGLFNSYRDLNLRDPSAPFFSRRTAGGTAGLDAKFVLKDRLVFDFAFNPDFSQVESDEPQNTVNQRFEVFFPEKRPFFMENSNYFDTPAQLLFTRRISDPEFGARITGKVGHFAVGALLADDRSPGRQVPLGDPLFGKRAYFGVLRINRDFHQGSSVGMIFTDRQFANGFNRVGGIDFHLKIRNNWVAEGQAVTSSTKFTDGTTQAGPAYNLYLRRNGRKLFFDSFFLDDSPGFLTQTGFFQRPDIRRFSNLVRYSFRPEGKHLISHGPRIYQRTIWAHDGTRLENQISGNYRFELSRQTEIGVFGNTSRERLRPSDFSSLLANQDYTLSNRGFFFSTAFFPQVAANAEAGWGLGTNYQPATGPPFTARSDYIDGGVTLYPVTRLTIDNRYIHSRLRLRGSDTAVFNNHVIRSKWNYQFTRELSLRLILQYNAVLANPQFTSLTTTKKINADFLITYLLHPGTAVYVGYNSNMQNIDPSLTPTATDLLRTRNHFINDSRQFFVKVSYLLRY